MPRILPSLPQPIIEDFNRSSAESEHSKEMSDYGDEDDNGDYGDENEEIDCDNM